MGALGDDFRPQPKDIQPCKCGTFPKVGDTFYYKSIYSTDYTIGTVRIVYDKSIRSSNGILFNNYEIEIKPKHLKREELLNKLDI